MSPTTHGETQAWRFSYNAKGNVTKIIDPVGRITSHQYYPNDVDISATYQRNPSGLSPNPDGQNADKIASYTYNALHEPLTVWDAAGQVTTYAYNTHGQIETATNAKGEVTTYAYGPAPNVPADYLASITGPALARARQ